jgi:hypothetical protein
MGSITVTITTTRRRRRRRRERSRTGPDQKKHSGLAEASAGPFCFWRARELT